MPTDMENATSTCSKCQSTMLPGFIPDITHGGVLVSTWQEGRPRKSFWRGLKLSYDKGLPIRAFRCSGCGYLEFYADKQFAAT